MKPTEKSHYWTEKIEEEEQKALTASYLIYKEKDTGIIYAKNGDTGKIDFYGTDAASVIQSALDSLTPNRTWKEKIALIGNFLIDKCIEVPSYTIIELIGKIKLKDNSSSNLEFPKHAGQYGMFYLGDEVNGATQIQFIGGEIDGNKANQPDTPNYYGIVARKVWNVLIYNVKVHDTKETGIAVEYGTNYGWIANCEIYNTGYDGIGCGGFGTINHEIWFVNNRIYGTIPHNAIVVERENYNVHIIGNDIDYNTETAGCAGIRCGGAYDIEIIGNTVRAPIQHGIRIDGDSTYQGRNVIIAENIVKECRYQGIYITRNVANTVISNNIVFNCGYGGYSGSGIVLDGLGSAEGDPNGILITNNRTFDNQATKTQDYGIAILANSTNVYIFNNDVRGNEIEGIYNAGVSPIIIKNNIGYVTENFDTATFSGDGVTTQFTIAHGLVSTPSKVQVTPMSSDAAGDFYVTADATNIYVNYITAPASGTDNVKLSWYAEV